MNINNISLSEILFIDIETVPQYKDYNSLPENDKKFWDKKAEAIKKSDNDTPEKLYNRAAIYAEFGKIICIALGIYNQNGDQLRIKSIAGHDEKKILNYFIEILDKCSLKYFCGHNIKEFDIPYICRRIIINGMKIPELINFQGKKPWETNIIDTMEFWKFGDVKNFTSLDHLCYILNVPTPKDVIDGSQIYEYYWIKNDLNTIEFYCKKDIVAVARLLMKFKNLDIISDEKIVFV